MDTNKLNQIIQKTTKLIAPAWPLKNSVAVNPFLGLSELSFEDATILMTERSGINTTMPLEFYLNAIDKKQILNCDIENALLKHPKTMLTVDTFKSQLKKLDHKQNGFRTKTVVDLAQNLTGKNWNDFMLDKISSWTASYYDEHQALWNTVETSAELFEAWKQDAEIDRSTELMGIRNFRNILKQIPSNHLAAAQLIIEKLNIPEALIETYLHTLLLKTIGWSSFAAGKDFENNVYGENTNHTAAFLSILLAWEFCLYESLETAGIAPMWENHKAAIQIHKEIGNATEALSARIILQDAYDRACERELKEKINTNKKIYANKERSAAQAVFCIDVRSEVYRRNLEKVDQKIETLGFAGFFGFPINYIPLTHQTGKNHCPVLIPSGPIVREKFSNNQAAIETRTRKHQFAKTWKKYTAGAATSFGFVSTMGLFYLPKLMRNSFSLARPNEHPEVDGLSKHMEAGRELDVSAISLSEKISMSAAALTAMGLKENLSPLVLIIGHGSSSTNNPHASGLDCGACGGLSGEINAMTAAQLLNEPAVRLGLALEKNIQIPKDTLFVAAKHDTATDEIKLNIIGEISPAHKTQLESIKLSLKIASKNARTERAERFGISNDHAEKNILKRGKDWAQVRPEWGLAGCNAFIIAPRNRTKGVNLEGKSFLHSYDWKTDKNFKILESIMTAPMVVTSWINLQYYASTTDNERLGAGNKTLHNVTGGIGVLEGSAGDLRIGLPWQSIHDGKKYQHLPQRLNVVIEAPTEAITTILQQHASIRNLCDNSWINILALNEKGKIAKRYLGNYKWEDLSPNKTTNKLNTVSTF